MTTTNPSTPSAGPRSSTRTLTILAALSHVRDNEVPNYISGVAFNWSADSKGRPFGAACKLGHLSTQSFIRIDGVRYENGNCSFAIEHYRLDYKQGRIIHFGRLYVYEGPFAAEHWEFKVHAYWDAPESFAPLDQAYG
jgi:hypothetical protein